MKEVLSAAAVIWRRSASVEVYLARRVPRMRFFGSVFAFSGGRVDPADEAVGGTVEGSLRSAVVRELIEELGIDLRRRGERADPQLRSGLCEESIDWADRCPRTSLDAIDAPCLRLVTPDFYPRRFDTWFFVVEVDPDCAPDLLAAELDAGGWDTPARWLERWQSGAFHLAPPTLLMLRVLAAHPPGEWPGQLAALQRRIEEAATIQEIRLDPAVRLMPLRTPTLPPARYTNAYLVGERDAWLVDPATPWPDGQQLLARTLDEWSGNLGGVILTHDHQDHTGAARFVADRYAVPVLAHAVTASRLAGQVRIDRTIDDGEELGFVHADGQPGRLIASFTPGHALGHLCFLESRYGGLLAGDMVSTLSSILIDPEDGDMGDYLASLEKLARLPVRTVYPAHGPPDSRGTDLFRDQIAHRLDREAAVLEVARSGPLDLDELTVRVWQDVPRPMLGYARKSAVSILRKLVHEGRASFDGERAGPA